MREHCDHYRNDSRENTGRYSSFMSDIFEVKDIYHLKIILRFVSISLR